VTDFARLDGPAPPGDTGRMKAAILDGFGQPPRYGDFETPAVQAGETLVSVTAASIKQLDRLIASGKHYSSPRALPVVCGNDGVGLLADGTRVYFAVDRRPFGGMAELAPAAWTVPLPHGLSDALAAAIVNPAIGAWLPIAWRGAMRPGDTVLVLGATGASGRLAVKAARLLGAGRVIAAGRRQDVLASLDADAVIDLAQPPEALGAAFAAEAARGIDLIVDYIWGPPVEALIATLVKTDLTTSGGDGPGIRLVSVGVMAGAEITLPSAALRGSRLTILGSGTANFPPPAQMKVFVAEILARAASGEIGLEIDERPLSDVATAWSAPTGDRRIVLRPDADRGSSV
jgi:NADPH:quinone reductase-like Zn-dependent oxidoreductase